MSAAPVRRALASFSWAALACAAALLVSGCRDEAAQARRDAPAPEFVAVDLDGEVARLEPLRGKVVLVNFWLAGCGPCLAEMPKLDAFYQSRREKGFALVGVNMGQSEETVRQVARRLDVNFPLLVDPLKLTTERYAVSEAPTSFLIGPDGKIIERIFGPLDEAALERKIDRLL